MEDDARDRSQELRLREEVVPDGGVPLDLLVLFHRELAGLVEQVRVDTDAADPVEHRRVLDVASARRRQAKLRAQPAGEQAKFVANYQAKMKDFIANADKLEAALKAGDNAAAAKLCDALNDDQKAGHKEFRPPQKKKG